MNLNNVLVSGTVVGTFVTSAAGRDLRIDFTRSATRAQVREVLRAVAFNHTTASPVPGLRNVSFALTDGSSGQSQRTVRINVVPLDTLPVISGLPSTATSTLGSTGFAFAASAVITDDNFNMAGGELTVHFNNSRDFTRILISLGGPTFRKDAENNVYRGSVIIGTMNAGGGVGATALRITFNDKVTPAIAQELLRSLKVSTPAALPLACASLDPHQRRLARLQRTGYSALHQHQLVGSSNFLPVVFSLIDRLATRVQ